MSTDYSHTTPSASPSPSRMKRYAGCERATGAIPVPARLLARNPVVSIVVVARESIFVTGGDASGTR